MSHPESLRVDDAEIVRGLVAPLAPVRGYFLAREGQHRDTEFLEGGVALILV